MSNLAGHEQYLQTRVSLLGASRLWSLRWPVVEEEMGKRISTILLSHLRDEAPYDTDPNRPADKGPHLRDTLDARVQLGATGSKVEFTAAVPWADWVRHGVQPHVIMGNPILHFFNRKTGDEVFTRQVQHPGTRPNDFVRKAVAKSKDEVMSAWKESVAAAL